MHLSLRNALFATISIISLHLSPTLGWGFTVTTDPNSDLEDPTKLAQMVKTIKPLKQLGGQKYCQTSAYGTWTGFRVSQYGLLSQTGKERDLTPRWNTWKNPVRWIGFWQNGVCEGLPNLIVHFYDVPYTNQAIVWGKLKKWLEPIKDHDLQFRTVAEIPFGDVWFGGEDYIPEGAVAVRKSDLSRSLSSTKANYYVVNDAIAVQEVGPNGDPSFISAEDIQDWVGSGRIEGPPRIVQMEGEIALNISPKEGDYERALKLSVIPDSDGVYGEPPPPDTNMKTFLGGNYFSLITGQTEATTEVLDFFNAQALERDRQEEIKWRPQVLFPMLNANTKSLYHTIINSYVNSHPNWGELPVLEKSAKYKALVPLLNVLTELDKKRASGDLSNISDEVDNGKLWDLILGTEDRELRDLGKAPSEKVWDLVLGTKNWFHLSAEERRQRYDWMLEALEALRAPPPQPELPEKKAAPAKPVSKPVTKPPNTRPQNSQLQSSQGQQAGSRNANQLGDAPSRPLIPKFNAPPRLTDSFNRLSQNMAPNDRSGSPSIPTKNMFDTFFQKLLDKNPALKEEFNAARTDPTRFNFRPGQGIQQQRNASPSQQQAQDRSNFAPPNLRSDRSPSTSNNNQEQNLNPNQQQRSQNFYQPQYYAMPDFDAPRQSNSNNNQRPNTLNNNVQPPLNRQSGGIQSVGGLNGGRSISNSIQGTQTDQKPDNGPPRSLNNGNLPIVTLDSLFERYRSQRANGLIPGNRPQRSIDRPSSLNTYRNSDPVTNDLFSEEGDIYRNPFEYVNFGGPSGGNDENAFGGLGFGRMEEEKDGQDPFQGK
ncbi:hypothetical protein TWF694_006663 [Orbilia ellipsospora]|uniref:Uncharacterized protein n=1 Tax=Orbilia ellipsospora TaxID=2528407 RepID=A0AAV9XKU7_9PEZI